MHSHAMTSFFNILYGGGYSNLTTSDLSLQVDDYNLDIERFDVGNNIIQIKHSKSTDTWFVVRKTLDAQNISIQVSFSAVVFPA